MWQRENNWQIGLARLRRLWYTSQPEFRQLSRCAVRFLQSIGCPLRGCRHFPRLTPCLHWPLRLLHIGPATGNRSRPLFFHDRADKKTDFPVCLSREETCLPVSPEHAARVSRRSDRVGGFFPRPPCPCIFLLCKVLVFLYLFTLTCDRVGQPSFQPCGYSVSGSICAYTKTISSHPHRFLPVGHVGQPGLLAAEPADRKGL